MQKSRIKLQSNIPVILANGIFPKHDKCLNIIKNAGHLCNIEQPVSFNKVLLEFLLQHKDKANFKKV